MKLTHRVLFALALTLWVTVLLASAGFAAEAPKEKKGILLVAFGSSMPEGQAAIDAVADAVRKAYPGVEMRVAFTSRIVMRKIAREQNRVVDDPAISLSKMAFEGFTDVAVLSTHIIPGEEYQDLAAIVDGFRLMRERGTKSGFERLVLSEPLLAGEGDYEKLAAALTKIYGAEKEAGAVVLMGHGSPHFANAAYSELQTVLWRKAPNFFVGTVEGIPSLDDVIGQLKKTRMKNVAVAPLMLVAGDHAHNDMAGDEEDSWKSRLAKVGYKVTPKLKGLGQYPEVHRLLLDKLARAWN